MVPFAGGDALLERERELETLRDGVDRACAGEGTLLLIEGPAGGAGRRLPVGRPGLAAVSGLSGAADRGACGGDAAHRAAPGCRRRRGGGVVGAAGLAARRGRAVSAAAEPVGRGEVDAGAA